jgi:hypothetical protein
VQKVPTEKALSGLPASVQLGLRMFLSLREAIDFLHPSLMFSVLDELQQIFSTVPAHRLNESKQPRGLGVFDSIASFLRDAITGPLARKKSEDDAISRHYISAYELLIRLSAVQMSAPIMLMVIRLLLSNPGPDLCRLDVSASISSLKSTISRSSITGAGEMLLSFRIEFHCLPMTGTVFAEPELFSFGRGDTGRLGQGPALSSVHLPQRIEALKGKLIISLATFSTHSLCATGMSNIHRG